MGFEAQLLDGTGLAFLLGGLTHGALLADGQQVLKLKHWRGLQGENGWEGARNGDPRGWLLGK